MKTYLALNGMTRCVQVGDVIYIEATSGAVKRVGRSDAHATEFDLEAEEYVPLPKVRLRAHTLEHARTCWAMWATNIAAKDRLHCTTTA